MEIEGIYSMSDGSYVKRRIIYGMLKRASKSILNSFQFDINLWICLHPCPLIGIIRINKIDIGKTLKSELLNDHEQLRVRKIRKFVKIF